MRVIKAGMNAETELEIGEQVQTTVRGIIAEIRTRGDAALREFSMRLRAVRS